MWIGISIILAGLLVLSVWGNWNLINKNESMDEDIQEQEEYLANITSWVEEFRNRINLGHKRINEVDKKGSFSSDDEVGFAFQVIKETIEDLNELTASEEDAETAETIND